MKEMCKILYSSHKQNTAFNNSELKNKFDMKVKYFDMCCFRKKFLTLRLNVLILTEFFFIPRGNEIQNLIYKRFLEIRFWK